MRPRLRAVWTRTWHLRCDHCNRVAGGGAGPLRVRPDHTWGSCPPSSGDRRARAPKTAFQRGEAPGSWRWPTEQSYLPSHLTLLRLRTGTGHRTLAEAPLTYRPLPGRQVPPGSLKSPRGPYCTLARPGQARPPLRAPGHLHRASNTSRVRRMSRTWRAKPWTGCKARSSSSQRASRVYMPLMLMSTASPKESTASR